MSRVFRTAVLLALLSAVPAQAAACCLSSSAFGIGRLALWEKFAAIIGTSTSPVAGRWDDQGLWYGNSAGYAENEWRAQLSVLAAVNRRLQVSGRVPLLLTQKAVGALQELNGGLGDSLLALRYEPLYQGEYEFLPELALNAGVTVPVGRTAMLSTTDLGSDVTSRGAWVLSASASVEIARAIWFIQAAGGVTLPLPMETGEPGHSQQFGLGWQATVAGGAEVRKDLVLSLVGRYAFESPLKMDGQDVANSHAFDFGAGANVAFNLTPHWTVQGGIDVGLYASGLGANRQGRTTGNLGLRYAYY